MGSGLAARAAESGGADFLLAINAGRMRNMGAPSVASILPIMDANEQTDEFATTEVLSQVSIPVYLGFSVYGETVDADAIAAKAVHQGFDGLVNFPTSLHFPSSVQHILQRAGRGMTREVAVLAAAKQHGLKTLLYCANRTHARLGADAGLDMILLNFGWNSGGQFGHKKKLSLEEVAIQTREIGRLIKRIHPQVQFLLEGGPIVTAGDLSFVAQKVEFDGYVGGSTIERLPMETAITDLIASYRIAGGLPKRVSTRQRKLLSWGRQCGAIGNSKALLDCLSQLDKLSDLSAPVLIQYEYGVDITWVINAFERRFPDESIRTVRPVIEDRHASANRRLFGSANATHPTLGTLGDEACELLILHAPERLPARSQIRLARAIKEGWYYATGSRRKHKVSPRCVFISQCWSNQALPDTLESDLAALFDARSLVVPPLRERAEDIAALLAYYFTRIGLPESKQPQLSASALHQLQTYEWAANDQELYSIADILCLSDGEVDKSTVDAAVAQHQSGESTNQETARNEKTRIAEALWRHNFHKSRTANALGISRKTLYNKIRRYRLDQ